MQDMKQAVESTRKLVLEWMPNEIDVLDEKALESAAEYLNANGYLDSDVPIENATTSQAYFAYDVLKFTSQNKG